MVPSPPGERVRVREITNQHPPSQDNYMPTITRALISVSDKAGVVEFARDLAEAGVEIPPPVAPPGCCAKTTSR